MQKVYNMDLRQKFYFQTIGVFVLFLAIVFISCGFLVGEINKLGKNYKKNQFALLNYRSRNAHYSRLLESYKKNFPVAEKLDEFLVEKDNPLDFVIAAENLAKRFVLSYSVRFLGEGGNDGGRSYLSFQISAGGDFGDFMKFLDAFENMPFFLRIEKIQINSSAPGIVSGNFQVKIYSKQ